MMQKKTELKMLNLRKDINNVKKLGFRFYCFKASLIYLSETEMENF